MSSSLPAGKNVYPEELERKLAGIAGVKELCVIGVWDEETLGERPHLVVVPEPQWASSPERLSEFERRIARRGAEALAKLAILSAHRPSSHRHRGVTQNRCVSARPSRRAGDGDGTQGRGMRDGFKSLPVPNRQSPLPCLPLPNRLLPPLLT
jgi:hypothetical protein